MCVFRGGRGLARDTGSRGTDLVLAGRWTTLIQDPLAHLIDTDKLIILFRTCRTIAFSCTVCLSAGTFNLGLRDKDSNIFYRVIVEWDYLNLRLLNRLMQSPLIFHTFYLPHFSLFYFSLLFLNFPMVFTFSRLSFAMLRQEEIRIGNVNIKIIRHYRNAGMTLIGRASLAAPIRTANISGFTECKKALRRIMLIHIAREAEDISLRARGGGSNCMMRIKCRLWLIARGFAIGESKKDRPHPQRIFDEIHRGSFSFAAAACKALHFGISINDNCQLPWRSHVKSVPADPLVSDLSTLLGWRARKYDFDFAPRVQTKSPTAAIAARSVRARIAVVFG